MLNALKSFEGSSSGGLYINSCFAHCQSEIQDIWFAPDSPRIQNKVYQSTSRTLFMLYI